MSASAPVTLYLFNGSNACLVAELMLRHKGIGYRPVAIPPAAHAVAVRVMGFPGQTVPAMKVGRRRVQGTRAISRALDEIVPERPLFPPDVRRRLAVEGAELRGEEMQDAARRIFYAAARRDPGVFGSVVGHEFGPRTRSTLDALRPVILALASLVHRATDDAARADLAALPRMLAEVEAWLDEGVVGGEQLNAADFQLAASVRPLLLAEQLAPYVSERLEAHLLRVAPDYPGHIPAVLPPEWLPAVA